MTASEYLNQIKNCDIRINQKLVELQQLRSMATSITAPIGGDMVQTSGSGDKVGHIVAKIIDTENEINRMIDEYLDMKNACIRTIEKLTNPLQYIVIHKHYVEGKTLYQISDEEGYSYQYIIEIHNSALNEIEKYL